MVIDEAQKVKNVSTHISRLIQNLAVMWILSWLNTQFPDGDYAIGPYSAAKDHLTGNRLDAATIMNYRWISCAALVQMISEAFLPEQIHTGISTFSFAICMSDIIDWLSSTPFSRRRLDEESVPVRGVNWKEWNVVYDSLNFTSTETPGVRKS
ncbi:hypothetical protein G7Y79_00024g055170 [Physcia stellaris]|nr:hypothetical protein G7Y79_00024g055170 [Physcia stellaris]